MALPTKEQRKSSRRTLPEPSVIVSSSRAPPDSSRFSRSEKLPSSAQARSARSKGNGAQTLTEHTSTPPHILGNFPRVELVFICSEKNFARQSDLPIFTDERYIKLSNFKKLLDSGAITQQEFEAEKAKILRGQ